jgi:hypothetical protein
MIVVDRKTWLPWWLPAYGAQSVLSAVEGVERFRREPVLAKRLPALRCFEALGIPQVITPLALSDRSRVVSLPLSSFGLAALVVRT